jgi:P-type E1-E2 ATPase
MKEKEILEYVACLEKQSTHPISTAFNEISTNYLVDEYQNISGIGIYGEVEDKEIYIGNNKILDKLKIKNEHKKDEEILVNDLNSVIYVIIDKKVVSLIGVKDIIRDDVKNVIMRLKKLDKSVIMLSGDNEKVATLVGNSLGINKVIANVVPKEKEKVIKDYMKGSRVMMVGDGINDALALTSSDIGVSVNSGTDIALDVADVILLNDDLSKIVSLIDTSNKTIKIIKENLFWAFFYNLLMIPIAMGLLSPLGISMSPMFGSIFMTISSLTVVFNSLRLRK